MQSNSLSDVHIFPNPVKNTINIVALNYNTADIYDVQGKLVKTISIKKYVSEYDIYDLENGIYIIKFNSGEITKFKKFIKQ
jgi:hypothetical protein